MINKYNTAKADLAKLLLDFVLADEAQTAFAEFGARPIRYVLGDLELPDEAKAKWLPDAAYADVAAGSGLDQGRRQHHRRDLGRRGSGWLAPGLRPGTVFHPRGPRHSGVAR